MNDPAEIRRRIIEAVAPFAQQIQQLTAVASAIELAPPSLEALNRLAAEQSHFAEVAHTSVQFLRAPMETLMAVDAAQQIARAEAQFQSFNWTEIAAQISTGAEQLVQLTKQLPIGVPQFFQELALAELQTSRLEGSGWLPHYTTPVEMIDACGDDFQLLQTEIADYYRMRWVEVRANLLQHLNRYDINQESKDTFLEALVAHESGLYRCVVRTLFPEIERLARIELHADALVPITSQRELRETAGNLVASSIEPGGRFALALYICLEDHLYAKVAEENTREKFAKDGIPNRHAALHGLVPYTTAQNSLNTIFMADYIFQVIHVTKTAGGD